MNFKLAEAKQAKKTYQKIIKSGKTVVQLLHGDTTAKQKIKPTKESCHVCSCYRHPKGTLHLEP